MRITFLILFICAFRIHAKAQDIITLLNGNNIQAKITEISSDKIKYKKYSNLDGPIYDISNNEVASIKYQNGTFELITQPVINNSQQPSVNQNRDDNIDKILEQILSVVKIQARRDSVLRIELKEMQEQLNKQNEQYNNAIIDISGSKNKTDTTHQGVLKEIQENSKEQKYQLIEAVKAVKEINSAFLDAEDEKNMKWKPKPIAFGVDLLSMLFPKSSVLYETFAPSVIVLSLTPYRHIKIETEFAGAFSTGVVATSYFALGLGGMWQGRTTNFYAGVKGMFYSGVKTTVINPNIGAEYIFGNRFSIGSEIGFPFIIDGDTKAISIGFNRVFLKFYLGGREKKGDDDF